MDPDHDQMQELMMKLQNKRKKQLQEQKATKPQNAGQSRKKDPVQVTYSQPKKNQNHMDIQTKKINKWKFQDLPEDLHFFLTEIYDMDRKRLYLTGIMENGQAINLIANESLRELYFALKDEDQEEIGMSQAYLRRAEQQIRMRLKKIGLRDNEYSCEMVKKQYVFEISGIPRNVRYYCKVRFSFNQALNEEIQANWQGQTFKYIFGTTYTPLQLLIINKGIKGPCWVTVKKGMLRENTKGLTNGLCIEIDFSDLIEVCEQKSEPPSFKVLSFSLKSVIPSEISTKKYFPTERKDETHIYAISYHYCEDYQVNFKQEKPKLLTRTYFLETLDRDNNKHDPFFKCKTESDMIGRFLADIIRLDPDFIVCHDSSKILDTLVCRLPKLSTDKNNKNKFGRLNQVRDSSKNNQYQRLSKFIAGRLLVDTYLHSKQMVKQIDYELHTMATHIKGEKKFTGISEEQAKVLLSTQKPRFIINKCAEQSQLTFKLMNNLEIIQMTKQLSNICGNLWKRSLQNKRAERNQFLIMHECFDRDLIIPDKFKKIEDDDGEGRKKYQGGMVIEPKKGFKPDYILLLDFNSLYPSIIREYNVCFSKIQRPQVPIDFYYRTKKAGKKQQKKKEVDVDENPEQDELETMFRNVKNCKSAQQWGFLPQIVDKIVARRKKCKNLLKKAKNAADKQILDIKQKCYKLVANSIYGCLGFSVSRFYSRPLAALITKKGRDSLIAAKDIAIKRGIVDVIYGDTDSIMLEPVNLKGQQQEEITEVGKLKLLKKIADQLKKQINSQYRFLEIDIDGIYKPLLLLMKKRYVANKLTNFQQVIQGRTQTPKFALQYKGIQLVRRDGCKVARDTQEDVIKMLVKTDEQELDERINQIVEYFTKLKDSLKSKPIDHFLFSKQLSKNPKEYANGENMPHVKVALDLMKAGQRQESLVNHTIYYLICKEKDKEYRLLAEQAFDMKNYERTKKFQPERQIEIDYQYYKEVILEPVIRLLINIDQENVIRDRLGDAIDLKKERRKRLFEKFEDTEEISAQRFGEVICQNKKIKAKELSSEIYQVYPHQIACPKCPNKLKLVDTEKHFTLITKCSQCGHSFSAMLYNILRSRFAAMINSYYSNKKRCPQCSKTYDLDLIGFCCQSQKKSKNKPKDEIAFKLHNLFYLCKQITENTLSSNIPEVVSKNDEEGIHKVLQMVEQFMEKSEYENISNAMAKLSI